ncbi:MAG: hypothetical protein NTU79_11125 [Planctomycetota bacterium]|nr:hypothetical protein [Planctomycetota bacterium]
MMVYKFWAFGTSALLSVFLQSACFGQGQCEDPAGHALRELTGTDTSVHRWGMVLPDGLTFAQREFLYGFTSDPSLFQGTFIYTNFMVSNEFDASVDPAEHFDRGRRLFGQVSIGSHCYTWLTNDEFHRGLAMTAEFLGDPDVMTTGTYTFHASMNAAGDRLILLLTPTSN